MTTKNGTPTTNSCKRCPDHVRLIKQQTKEIEALAKLAVNQRSLLAKIPADPRRVARDLVKKYNADSLDVLVAEIMRLCGG